VVVVEMSWPRIIAIWAAIGAMGIAVVVAVAVCIRIGLAAFENLEEVQPTLSNVLAEAVKASGTDEATVVVTANAIVAGVAIAW
jgi:hypothetical protein